MVASDHPDRAVVFQNAAGSGQPGPGKAVIGRKAVELVPIIVDGINHAALGPHQVSAELQIIGRIGEYHVDGFRGQGVHRGDAILAQYPVQRQQLTHENPLFQPITARRVSQPHESVNQRFCVESAGY